MSEETESFEAFFRRDYARLISFVRKLGFDHQEAQDAASEAMTRACAAWLTLTNPSAWVRTVASRIAMNDAARDRKRDQQALSEWSTARKSEHVNFLAFDDILRITCLLNMLSRRQRMVMAWRLDGFTTSEIAEQMEISEATVRSTLRDARRRLKDILGLDLNDSTGHRTTKEVPGREW